MSATTPRATATVRSPWCRSTTPTATTRPPTSAPSTPSSTTPRSRARRSTCSRRCRSASSTPTAPCRPTASTLDALGGRRDRLRLHAPRDPGRHLHRRRDVRRQPGLADRHPALPRPDRRRRLPAARQHRVLRRRLRRYGDRRPGQHRLRLRQPRQAGPRRRGDQRPGDRLLRLRHRQGRRRRLLHGGLRRLRRQRRLAGAGRDLRVRRCALRQRLAALVVAGVLLLRPRHRPARLHHRRPAQEPRGPAALVHRRQLRRHDHRGPRRGPQGLRPRRPLQRQPRDRDRQGERHLARVRPLAGPPGLLLHGQQGDLRRLEPDGDRQVAEHRRLRPPGARLGRAPGADRGHRRSTGGTTPRRTSAPSRGRPANGTPYRSATATDGIVRNSEMYVAKLPGRTLLDPAAFDSGDTASETHAWWSRVRQRLRLRRRPAVTTSTSRSPSSPTVDPRAAR